MSELSRLIGEFEALVSPDDRIDLATFAQVHDLRDTQAIRCM